VSSTGEEYEDEPYGDSEDEAKDKVFHEEMRTAWNNIM
jgi:hypothetical protein